MECEPDNAQAEATKLASSIRSQPALVAHLMELLREHSRDTEKVGGLSPSAFPTMPERNEDIGDMAAETQKGNELTCLLNAADQMQEPTRTASREAGIAECLPHAPAAKAKGGAEPSARVAPYPSA